MGKIYSWIRFSQDANIDERISTHFLSSFVEENLCFGCLLDDDDFFLHIYSLMLPLLKDEMRWWWWLCGGESYWLISNEWRKNNPNRWKFSASNDEIIKWNIFSFSFILFLAFIQLSFKVSLDTCERWTLECRATSHAIILFPLEDLLL